MELNRWWCSPLTEKSNDVCFVFLGGNNYIALLHLGQPVVERPGVMLIAVFTFAVINGIIYNFWQKTCKQGEIQINYNLSYKYA